MSVKVDMDACAEKLSEDALLQAERWTARLGSPECSSAERETFERWCAADAAHAQAYGAVRRLMNQAGGLANDPAVAAALAAALKPTAVPVQQSRRRVFAAVAAGLATLLVTGGVVYRVAFSGVYRTHLGEQRAVTLADGTKMLLDTSSSLLVRFDGARRRIELKKGRAQFDVAPDSSRPFIVQAGGSTVTALGTVFDVRNEHDEVSVTLLMGKVDVAQQISADKLAALSHEILEPGERWTAVEHGHTRKQVVDDLQAAVSWTRGDLVFKATALATAVAEVNRYTARRIEIAPEVADIPISGVFHVGDTAAILIALEKSFPIKVIPADGGGVRLASVAAAQKNP